TVLASAGKDNEVRIWDAGTGQLLQRLTGFAAEVQTLAFSGDGRMLATGDWAGVIQIWQVPPRTKGPTPDQVIGRRLWSVAPADHGMGRHLWSVALSPDGHYLAAAGGLDEEPGGVTLWRIKPGGGIHDKGSLLRVERLPGPSNPGLIPCVTF